METKKIYKVVVGITSMKKKISRVTALNAIYKDGEYYHHCEESGLTARRPMEIEEVDNSMRHRKSVKTTCLCTANRYKEKFEKEIIEDLEAEVAEAINMLKIMKED